MKVLPKIIRILELFRHGDTLTFARIVESSGLTRSNTAHLVSALCQNGLLEKTSFGCYRAGEKLFELAGGDQQATLSMLARRCADNVAGTIRELGVVVGIWQNRRITLAKTQPERMVQLSIANRWFEHSGWYKLSSGRLLLALQSDDAIREIIRTAGMPAQNEWPEAVTPEGLWQEIARIRLAREVVMTRGNGRLTSIAVPVTDAAGEASLCVSTVFITGSQESPDSEIAEKLRVIAEDLHSQIVFHRIAMRRIAAARPYSSNT